MKYPGKRKNLWRPGDRRTPHMAARGAAPEIVLTMEEAVLATRVENAGRVGRSIHDTRLSVAIRLALAGRVHLRGDRIVAP